MRRAERPLPLARLRSADAKQGPDQEGDPRYGADHIDDLDATLSPASSRHPDAAPGPGGEPLGALERRILNGSDHDSGCDPAPGSPEEKCGEDGCSQKKVGDDHYRSVPTSTMALPDGDGRSSRPPNPLSASTTTSCLTVGKGRLGVTVVKMALPSCGRDAPTPCTQVDRAQEIGVCRVISQVVRQDRVSGATGCGDRDLLREGSNARDLLHTIGGFRAYRDVGESAPRH